MKRLLLILLCCSFLFATCKKEKKNIAAINSSNSISSIFNVWGISTHCISAKNGETYFAGSIIDDITGTIYSGMINSLDSGITSSTNDTIFPSLSINYSSRIWSINQNQTIVDTYYDSNGFPFVISEHNFTINSDTLIIDFQSGAIQKFVINELTSYNLNIYSIADTNISPVFNINGIYTDTVLIDICSDNYNFNIVN